LTRAIRRIAIAAILAFGCSNPSPSEHLDGDTSCKPGAACDDGDLDTSNDLCREGGTCVGTPILCPDHDCVEGATPNGVDCDVTYRPDGAVCDDGSVCTDGDLCDAGSCHAGPPVVCDDGDPCTEDACDTALGCASAWVGGEDCIYDCTITGEVLGGSGSRRPNLITNVVVVDGVAIVGTSLGVDLYDVSVPHRPGLVGAVPLPSSVLALEVQSDIVYVALRYGDVVTLDVSDPTAPLPLGVVETEGEVRGMHLSDTTAYLADDDRGLLIYDVSDPSAPVLEGVLSVPGWALDVHVVGDVAFIANRLGLIVADVTKPSAAKQVAFLDTPGYALAVEVQGLKAYVSHRSGVMAVDVTAPTHPVVWSRYYTPGYATALLAQDGVGYVADYEAGLALLDVDVPSQMVSLGALNTPGHTLDVDLVGTTAYLADSEAGLRIVDVSEPSSPIELGAVDDRGSGQSIHLRGDLAYLSDGLGGLSASSTSRTRVSRRSSGGSTRPTVGPGRLTWWARPPTWRRGPRASSSPTSRTPWSRSSSAPWPCPVRPRTCRSSGPWLTWPPDSAVSGSWT
jgi:hypothetical protein